MELKSGTYKHYDRIFEVKVAKDMESANRFMATANYGVLATLPGGEVVMAEMEDMGKPAPEESI